MFVLDAYLPMFRFGFIYSDFNLRTLEREGEALRPMAQRIQGTNREGTNRGQGRLACAYVCTRRLLAHVSFWFYVFRF